MLNRRSAMKLIGGSTAALGLGGAGGWALIPPSPSKTIESADRLVMALLESLDAEDRRRACVPYDHPLRQYHNRGVWGGGLTINPFALDRDQRRLVTDLMFAGLSQPGRSRVPEEFYLRFTGVHGMRLLVCGDPRSPPYQIILSGPHLNLRLGGASREGVAFGGPQIYGDQRGNFERGLPGNLYRFQLQIAQQLFESLGEDQKRRAVLERAPIQTQIELKGRHGSFAGVKVESLSLESKKLAQAFADAMLSTYPEEDVAHARRCLDANGGIDALHFSCYRDGEVARGEHQIFRLEGPAAVFYFRGYPHVHAFINIGMDGDLPLSVGAIVGENPASIEGERLRRLFEDAMRAHAGTELAYYPSDSAVGRIRSGTIRTGDIYTAESWQNRVAIVEVEGSKLSPPLVAELRARGIDPASRTHAIATIDYAADQELVGEIDARTDGPMLRDVTIEHLRKRGFPS